MDRTPQTTGSTAIDPSNILIPKGIGALNVGFGLLLLACGLCYTFYVPGLAAMQDTFSRMLAEQRVKVQQASKQEIARLRALEAKAESEDEKATIRDQISAAAAKAAPDDDFPDFGHRNFGFDDGRVFGYFVADTLSGIVFNGLLLVSGIGLMARREWARKFGVGLAWAKVARLAILTAVFLAVALPVMRRTFEAAIRSLNADPKVTPTMAASNMEMVRTFHGAMVATALFVLVVGLVYPAITIVLLRRPSAVAACRRPAIPAGSPVA